MTEEDLLGMFGPGGPPTAAQLNQPRTDRIRAEVAAAQARGQAAGAAQQPQSIAGIIAEQSDALGAGPLIGNSARALDGLGDAMFGAGNPYHPQSTSGIADAMTRVGEGVAVLGGPGTVSAGAAPRSASTLGIFGGKNAIGADTKALAKAGRMEKRGASEADSWRETGWAKGADGKRRFEIPDIDARIRGEIPADGTIPLGDLLDHPRMFDAYPDMRGIPVSRMPDEAVGAAYDSGAGMFASSARGPEGMSFGRAPEGQTDLGQMLHEAQHAIQSREGFDAGSNAFDGSLRYLADNPSDTAKGYLYKFGSKPGMHKYQENAGEVEARNVQKRFGMSPDELRATPPSATASEPAATQWYKGGPAVPMSAENKALYEGWDQQRLQGIYDDLLGKYGKEAMDKRWPILLKEGI